MGGSKLIIWCRLWKFFNSLGYGFVPFRDLVSKPAILTHPDMADGTYGMEVFLS